MPVSGGGFSGAASARLGVLTTSECGGACRFTRLSAEGAPISGAASVATRPCFDLQPTPAGFSVLTTATHCGMGEAVGLARFDATGGASSEVELVPTADHASAIARVVRPDGGFVLVWGSADGRLATRRFAADGTPVTTRTEVTTLGPDAGRLVVAAVQGGALAAWSRRDPVGGGFQVHVVSLDEDGRPRTRPVPLDAPRSGRSANLALTSSGEGAMLAWTEAARDGGVAMRVMPLSSAGRPVGGVVTLGEFGHDVYFTYPTMLGSTDGILVVYLAQRDPAPAPMQVYASWLTCRTLGS